MIVIIGAGLAGLSTAAFLGRVPYKVFEREDTVGGVCRSHTVDGFTFDRTGHVLHFKNQAVRAFVESLLNGALVSHARRSAVYSHGVYTPYPFQANLHGLPPEVVRDCLLGFVAGATKSRNASGESGRSFRQWIDVTFGDGIAKHFMVPFNEKLWQTPLEELTADWTARLVPRPTLRDVVNGALGLRDKEFGYNTGFYYPRSGGIGTLPEALSQRVVHRLHCKKELMAVEMKRKRVRFRDGSEEQYEALVSTIPLPDLLTRCVDLPKSLREAAGQLRWISVYAVNLAIAREGISDSHWIYFPEKNVPFYRVGLPMNLTPAMGRPGATSLSVEISHRPETTISHRTLIETTKAGLVHAGLCRRDETFLVEDVRDIPHAYVIFDRQRARIVRRALAELERRGIYSIGRYGRWEHTSMEDAIRQGQETAKRLRKKEFVVQ